jgi:hypothetical protein
MNIKSAVIAAAVSAVIAPSVLAAQASQAQPSTKSSWELGIPSGTLVPTGSQRDAIKRGNLTAIQLMYVVKPRIAITSSFGWARSRDVLASGSPKLDVFTYDAGAELRAPSWKKNFTPFAGAGVGGRSYNHRKLEMDATHNLSAYASAGGELAVRRVRVRLEARDYVSGFKPLSGAGDARTSNDVVVMAGLRIVGR